MRFPFNFELSKVVADELDDVVLIEDRFVHYDRVRIDTIYVLPVEYAVRDVIDR